MAFAPTKRPALIGVCALAAAFAPATGRAAEHVTLRNGFAVDCVRQQAEGGRVRLYLAPAAATAQLPSLPSPSIQSNYLEVGAAEIVRVDALPDPAISPAPSSKNSERISNDGAKAPRKAAASAQKLSASEAAPMLAAAQSKSNVDADLLWSVMQAESAGRVRAVSRAGALGLMQLMPGTAAGLGVKDTFAPEQNIGGGAAYLDQMLARYHDNMALALAAYNAGPAAVDRWGGVPPYRETRAYVARVIHQFNARKRLVASK